MLTTKCNMNCRYCIAHDLISCSLTFEIGCKIIDLFLFLANGARNIEFVFTGGEPLLEKDLMKKLIFYAKDKCTNSAVKLFFTVKTNGLILDDDLLEFFLNIDAKIVISIDGYSEIHNLNRISNNGRNTHHLIRKNIIRLLKNKINCIASLTVHPNLSDNILKSVLYLQNIGIESLDVGPAYGTVNWTKENIKMFLNSLKNITSYLKTTNEKGINLEIGPFYKHTEHKYNQLKGVWGCGAAESNLAFLPDGKITGCSALAMLINKYPNLILGNIDDGINKSLLKEFLKLSQAKLSKRKLCKNCGISDNCAGGCLAINLSENGSPLTPPNFYCQTISLISETWDDIWIQSGLSTSVPAESPEKGH